jgi:hypothetical protein
MQVKIAGTTGTLDVEVQDGFTVKDVLIEAAERLGLTNPVETVERLTPIVGSKPAQLSDPVAPEARRVAAAPNGVNG